jgi:hypothetical protein
VALSVALVMALASCTESPTSFDSLPNGAFGGINTGLLSTLISHTTGILGDTAAIVLAAAEIGTSHLSGDPVNARRFHGFGVFDVGGTASQAGALSVNGIALRFVPDEPPAHYEIDTTATSVLSAERTVRWNAGWSTGEMIESIATLPQSFGNVTLSVGRTMPVSALDAGQDVTVRWSGVVPGKRVFMYATWQPTNFAPTLVVAPLPILVVADSGAITIPGKYLSPLVKQPDGHITFVLYRGSYQTGTTFDASTKTLGTFSYVSDSVRVELH